jgi:SAM-dependent methyltransferase
MSAIVEWAHTRPSDDRTKRSPVKAFSGRADNYMKYRAGYPDSLLDFLAAECDLTAEAVVADLGSGTGTLTAMLLDHGNSVFAVEPNPDMRAVAERLFSANDGFKSIDARAEATTLAGNSVDFVTAARALQWFDVSATLAEISRILRPGGWVVFVWNRRRKEASPFNSDYEIFLRTFCGDWREQAAKRSTAREHLVRSGFDLTELDFQHRVNLDELKGLVLSLSVSPSEEDPGFEPMLSGIADLFSRHQVDGHVRFDYSTVVYTKRLPF